MKEGERTDKEGNETGFETDRDEKGGKTREEHILICHFSFTAQCNMKVATSDMSHTRTDLGVNGHFCKSVDVFSIGRFCIHWNTTHVSTPV